MVEKLRIELVSTNVENLQKVSGDFKDVGEKMGIRVRGPIPLPTKKLKINTLRNPSGEGTNRWDRYEMRVHKRIVDILNPDERFIRRIMMISIPDDVKVSIVMMS